MTKEEFMGFSSAAQHDMVLEALVRVTKNLEIMEKASGKPFAGTSKQNANDIKLLTILAEAFGKNELMWDYARLYKNGNISESNYKARCDECMVRSSALFTGIGQQVYMEKSKPQPWDPSPMIDVTVDNSPGLPNPFNKALSASIGVHDYLKEKFGENNKES